MKRTSLNFLIDAVAFAALLLLVSTGMLLEYQLPAGSGGREPMGLGQGGWDRPVATLWGWTRHEWGWFHFCAAWALMAVLAVHIALHWKWIVCVLKGQRSEASGGRLALGVLGLVAAVVLTLLPLVSPTASTPRRELAGSHESTAAEGESDMHAGDAASLDIRGSSTLAEAAAATGQSVETLIKKLGLPADVAPGERIGPLLRRHGLRMSDLRKTAVVVDR